METHIGIKESDRKEVAEQLTKLLADEFILYTKTRNAHWNVEGSNFYSMHVFFEGQFNQLDDIMDRIAERIRFIGHYATATLKAFLEITHLTEAARNKNDSDGFVRELLADHNSIIEFIRGNIEPFANKYNDLGSSDFITGIMETHEKMAWMLQSHVN
jgi:starvation-inducible DNA-binding protein